jgi:hypothetical protein
MWKIGVGLLGLLVMGLAYSASLSGEAVLKQAARCEGRVVKVFSAADAGDSVRGEPVASFRSGQRGLTGYQRQRCVTVQSQTPIRSVIEQLTLPNGIRLVVVNTGWETVSYRITAYLPTSRRAMGDSQGWYREGAQLLNRVAALSQGESPLKQFASESAPAMAAAAQGASPLPLGEDVLNRPQEMALHASLEEVGETGPTGRILLSLGPL